MGNAVAADLEQRIERLKIELAEECAVDLGRESFEELAYARYVDFHEGRRPSYGAVIAGPESTTRQGTALPPPPSPAAFVDARVSISTARQFADGRTAFVARGHDGSHALVIDRGWLGNELALAAYAADTRCTVVQRVAGGRLRVFNRDRIFSYDDGIWLIRPTARSLFEAVGAIVFVDEHDVARSLLELSVHLLSPAGTGATLVWFPGGAEGSLGRLDTNAAYAPPALSIVEPSHAAAIAQGLGQLDRAVVVDRHGEVLLVNVTLPDDPAAGDLTFEGGTRHNSAGRYSAVDTSAIVFVVSADGPVTLFYQGAAITVLE